MVREEEGRNSGEASSENIWREEGGANLRRKIPLDLVEPILAGATTFRIPASSFLDPFSLPRPSSIRSRMLKTLPKPISDKKDNSLILYFVGSRVDFQQLFRQTLGAPGYLGTTNT